MISVPVGLLLRCFVNIGENEVDHEKTEKKVPTPSKNKQKICYRIRKKMLTGMNTRCRYQLSSVNLKEQLELKKLKAEAASRSVAACLSPSSILSHGFHFSLSVQQGFVET